MERKEKEVKKFDYYVAYDGTIFSGYGYCGTDEEREAFAKKQVEEYEATAAGVIGQKIFGSCIKGCSDKFSDSIDRMLYFYEDDGRYRYIFEPTSQEDINNLFIWVKLSGNDKYHSNTFDINKVKIGEKYYVYSGDGSTYIYSANDIRDIFEAEFKKITEEPKVENTDSPASN